MGVGITVDQCPDDTDQSVRTMPSECCDVPPRTADPHVEPHYRHHPNCQCQLSPPLFLVAPVLSLLAAS